jgi:hypothetical protein
MASSNSSIVLINYLFAMEVEKNTKVNYDCQPVDTLISALITSVNNSFLWKKGKRERVGEEREVNH